MADRDIKDIRTPDLGIDHTVPIAEIFVSEGDHVNKEDPLLSLESEKAVMDIPSPFEGIITQILVKTEDEIESGTLLMKVETGMNAVPLEKSQKEPEEKVVEQNSNKTEKPVTKETGFSEPKKNSSSNELPPGNSSHASPSVRFYARELSVDLNRLTGSGPKGRIRREDIQEYVKQNISKPLSNESYGGIPQYHFIDPSQFGPVEEQKLTGIQKVSAKHLQASWINIPHVTHYDKGNISDLESWRKTLNSSGKYDVKFTLLAFIVKALSVAVREYPRFNSVLAPQGDRILLRNYYNVGIAVDTPKGLLVPVIHDTNSKKISEIAQDIQKLAQKAREGRLTQDDMTGAGITVTNLGSLGGTGFTPIINPPEVAILGLSQAKIEPQWNGSEFLPQLMLPLSLSYDHRVIDGALAAAFTSRLIDILEDLRTILL